MDHNSSSVDERRDFALNLPALAGGLTAAGRVLEYLKLETCNRTELYAVLPEDGGEPFNAPGGARILYGRDAVRHLLRVLLGLESMARGESHIVSQVKSAYAASESCGKVLHRLFQRALGVAAPLRGAHPGREPSLPRIAVRHYLENSRPGRPAMVVGTGLVGRETALALLLGGRRTLVANRTPRPPDEKLREAEAVPWESWKERAAECGAVFLCTSSPTPILGAGEASSLRDVMIFDLGAPRQSEAPASGVRVTIDDMREIAGAVMDGYGKSLAVLEAEADRVSAALLAEISVLADDTWKRLAMSRANAIIKDRAARYAGKYGVPEAGLEEFALSVMSAFLHPLNSAGAAHGARAWRILSGERGEGSG
jgi:glutamyl-tRNA reductase